MDESVPLLDSSPQRNCRESRPHHLRPHWGKTKQILSYFLRFSFWSSGYNNCLTFSSQLYSFYMLLVCWYQVIYEIAKIAGCPEFECTEKVAHSTKQLEFASYLSAAIGCACSYTFMLQCLNIVYKRYSNAISPYVGLNDMGNSKAKIVLVTVLVSGGIFCGYVLLFANIVMKENTYHSSRLTIYLLSLACEFIAEWVSIVSLYAFACSAFAIGAFSSDTFHRIKASTADNIDDIIKIHKELRVIVRETTDAYSGWFLLHWLIYGITTIIGFVVVALHKFGHDEVIRKIYFGTFFSLHVFLFVFPCACAAFITSTCGSISARINNTTSEDWREGHLFKDRRQLQMFVSYCSASPVCFKIGRITFTSTLAWFSFFFGGTGLLFHFF